MRLIEPEVEEIKQEPGLEGIYKQIAIAGRICYASDKIDGNKEFVERLIKANHGRPLEFGTIYLKVHSFESGTNIYYFYDNNNYSKAINIDGCYYITTNYRVLVENNRLSDLKYLCEPTKYHHKRWTFHWTVSRGIADEFRTHCALSSLMQSTRYCDYSKNKFNNELTFIRPHWISSCEYDNCSSNERRFFAGLNRIEYDYLKFRQLGYKPEQAREILPLSIKTEFIQCGFESDWEHFFDLRMRGTTGAPHPDAKFIAEKAYEIYKAT